MCVFSIRSNGFLYHQIRLTMTILGKKIFFSFLEILNFVQFLYYLALIGNGLEDVGLITDLLDVEKNPRRPAYRFANPDGLILIDCNYEGLKWINGNNLKFSNGP